MSLKVEKPKPFWNREITTDLKALFGALGKTAVSVVAAAVKSGSAGGAARSWAAVGRSGVDIISALELKEGPEEKAYILLLGALNRAMAELLEENARHLKADANTEATANILVDNLTNANLFLDKSFLKQPESLPLLNDLIEPLAFRSGNGGNARQIRSSAYALLFCRRPP